MIRISGADTISLLRKFFIPAEKSLDGKEFLEHRRMTYGRLVNAEGELIDTCTAAYYRAPHSYTGEDMAEVYVHGSPAAMQAALEAFGTAARPAEAGEFTKRAFLNGKLDLSGAEAVMDMISANTELARKAAAEQLSGGLKKRLDGIYDSMTDAAAYIAAVIDYPDEMGDDTVTDAELIKRLGIIKAEVDALIINGLGSRVLREGARVAITGEPNAGKSSLLNALLLRERAIVTELAGTTRDTIEESSSVMGVPVVFIDTAGLNNAGDKAERLGVERAFAAAENSELILWLRQGDRVFTENEAKLFDSVKAKKHMVLFTKCDAWTKPDPEAEAFYAEEDILLISSVTGEGLEALRQRIAYTLHPTDEPAIVTNTRHINALSEASRQLAAAIESCESGMGADCCSTDLAEAMHSIGLITGRDAGEDVIDAIFSRFCVGK